MAIWQGKAVAVAVCLATTFMLYRDIRSVGRLSIVLWVVVIFTALAITGAGLLNFQVRRVFDFSPHPFSLLEDFFVGFGGATFLSIYDLWRAHKKARFFFCVRPPAPRCCPFVILSLLLSFP